jgi:hypothetical protein
MARTEEQYPMSEAHDTAVEPVLTGYVSSVPHRQSLIVSASATVPYWVHVADFFTASQTERLPAITYTNEEMVRLSPAFVSETVRLLLGFSGFTCTASQEPT